MRRTDGSKVREMLLIVCRPEAPLFHNAQVSSHGDHRDLSPSGECGNVMETTVEPIVNTFGPGRSATDSGNQGNMEALPAQVRADVTASYLIAADMEDVLSKIADATKALILISMAKGIDEHVAAAVHGLGETIASATDDARQMAEDITRKTWGYFQPTEPNSDLSHPPEPRSRIEVAS